MNRKEAVSALKSMELEGFIFTAKELTMWNKIAIGELPLQTAREGIIVPKEFSPVAKGIIEGLMETWDYTKAMSGNKTGHIDAGAFDYYMSLPYTVLIKPLPEGGYVAKIAELPGCLTQAESAEEAMAMIKDAQAAWIDIALKDGRVIPEPMPKDVPNFNSRKEIQFWETHDPMDFEDTEAEVNMLW